MNSLEILDKIENLRKQRGISVYRLTKDAGISHNTLNAWRKRQTMPSIGVLEAVCDVLNVSIAVLFMDENCSLEDLSAETKRMLTIWNALNRGQRVAVMNLLQAFINSEPNLRH